MGGQIAYPNKLKLYQKITKIYLGVCFCVTVEVFRRFHPDDFYMQLTGKKK